LDQLSTQNSGVLGLQGGGSQGGHWVKLCGHDSRLHLSSHSLCCGDAISFLIMLIEVSIGNVTGILISVLACCQLVM
jgi:hypothetical protein